MHDRHFICHMLHFKASTAKLAFLPTSSYTPLHVFTCSCKSTRLIICISFDEVNWLIKKLAQMTGQTHKWETPSRISQWHPVPRDQVGGVTLMAYMASLRHLGFACHLRERHPLLSLSDHILLCQLLDQLADFIEWAARDKARAITIANEDT